MNPLSVVFKKYLLYISFAINFLLVIVIFTPLTETLYKPLIIDNKPAKSEVIVVLSGGVYNDGFPTFSTIVRTMAGLDLYRQGYAPKIICTGGKVGEKKVSCAAPMKKVLVSFGVEEENVLIQDDTLNTYDDLTDGNRSVPP